MLAGTVVVEAHDRDQKRFEKLYDDYLVPGTDLCYAACKVCHVAKRALNAYGRALRRAKKTGKEPVVEIFSASRKRIRTSTAS